MVSVRGGGDCHSGHFGVRGLLLLLLLLLLRGILLHLLLLDHHGLLLSRGKVAISGGDHSLSALDDGLFHGLRAMHAMELMIQACMTRGLYQQNDPNNG
jgi:hypothetical protein